MSTKNVLKSLNLDKSYKRMSKYKYMGVEYRVFFNGDRSVLSKEENGVISEIEPLDEMAVLIDSPTGTPEEILKESISRVVSEINLNKKEYAEKFASCVASRCGFEPFSLKDVFLDFEKICKGEIVNDRGDLNLVPFDAEYLTIKDPSEPLQTACFSMFLGPMYNDPSKTFLEILFD